MYSDDETAGNIDRAGQSGWIAPSDGQRGRIFLDAMNWSDVPEVNGPASKSTAALPITIALQDLPVTVTRKIPLVRRHKFVNCDDRVLVVRPDDGAIMSEISCYRFLP